MLASDAYATVDEGLCFVLFEFMRATNIRGVSFDVSDFEPGRIEVELPNGSDQAQLLRRCGDGSLLHDTARLPSRFSRERDLVCHLLTEDLDFSDA